MNQIGKFDFADGKKDLIIWHIPQKELRQSSESVILSRSSYLTNL